MTGSSASPGTSLDRKAVPAQRSSADHSASEHAARGLAAVGEATERLYAEVSRLGDADIVQPTRLPGWTRAHVVTHLARNADALVNLLTWARTGIEHPMYASRADRDADIEEGAKRLAQVIREDLLAACTRLETAADRMAGTDWRAQVAHRTGRVFPAADIPGMRLFEVWVHLVDLEVGVDFHDVPAAHLELLLEPAVHPHVTRTEGTPVQLSAELPGGDLRRWRLVVPAVDGSGEISGPAPEVIGWLTRRRPGTALTGPLPDLPPWG
ncbi:MAG TPA: maleylpyruvate isomerase N-terminal domain-containing protein [Actinophytocola sp.]|uniref:maleylpyruvate isomerase N-terminal domain-containing protein n=1 Tax=Actinophytocola sp. TaxID=1872138 RepID=UPI002DDCEDA5|nr:maleylpyruvate isomerase N-terminal domain-containing protein [Actinophytocola sp.]HEV2779396.1 maleylpyruvate isomerase N-terminal domain-containing protein [Actinophytocola sp.]